MTIKSGNLELRLKVVPVELLLRHEETFSDVVDKLVLELKNWAYPQNPIIIDENNIVLDGNHRTLVFEQLKFRYIPVCRIDLYSLHFLIVKQIMVCYSHVAPLAQT